MDTITIEGMDEHDFRHSLEDMLRADEGEAAIAKLRALLEPYAVHGGMLPPRILEVSPRDVEFAGWSRLADRLLAHDRPGYPITAIGVTLSDARKLGGPGPSNGWLAPFIKTFYFSDDAYPFTDASRDDLLDGYTREGFGWQGDFQATDATLSIKGIDDLYGAIVTLEDRLLESKSPSEDEIRAGTIGACYLAALIHQALRDTIRKKGLPRPLCVLAACDGVYPFFDAPVAGQDETALPQAAEGAEDALEEEWPDEADDLAPALRIHNAADMPSPEASLVGLVSRKGTKAPVLMLDDAANEDAARYTEMASAQRMLIEDESTLKGLLAGIEHDPALTFEPEAAEDAALWEGEQWDEPEPAAALLDGDLEVPSELPDPLTALPPEPEFVEPPVLAPPVANSFRARIRPVEGEAKPERRDWVAILLTWFGRFLPRRQAPKSSELASR